jgi:hypothetical protein
MIQQINDYFRFDRSYEGGLKLVMHLTQKMALKKQLNVQPPSAYLHGVIHEELRQLAGYSFKDFELLLSQPVLEKQTGQNARGQLKTVTNPADLPNPGSNLPGQKKASREK